MHKKPFPRFIIFTIIIYAVVNIVFLLVSNIIYVNGRWTYRHSVTAMNSLYTVSDNVDSVNTQVEQLIDGENEKELIQTAYSYGFKQEAVMKQNRFFDGIYYNTVISGIYAEDVLGRE